jgi:hypothetical protein
MWSSWRALAFQGRKTAIFAQIFMDGPFLVQRMMARDASSPWSQALALVVGVVVIVMPGHLARASPLKRRYLTAYSAATVTHPASLWRKTGKSLQHVATTMDAIQRQVGSVFIQTLGMVSLEFGLCLANAFAV